MNLNRSESFEELCPRIAPTPLNFSDASPVSTVPEVSLVFSNSPFTLKQSSKEAPISNLETNRRNSISKKEMLNEKRIPDNSYKTLPIGLLGKNPAIYSAEKTSQVGYIPSMLPRNTSCRNDELIGKPDVDPKKEMTKQVCGCKFKEHINMEYVCETLEEKYDYQRGLKSHTANSRVTGNCDVCNSNIKMKPFNQSELHLSSEVTDINSMTSHNCIQNRPAPPLLNHTDSRQFHCYENNDSIITQNMFNGSISRPVNVSNFNSHIGVSEHRQAIESPVPYSESCRKLRNMCSVQSGRLIGTADTTKKCCDCNKCFLEKTCFYTRNNNCIDEVDIPSKGSLVSKHNGLLNPSDNEHLKINFNCSNNDSINPTAGGDLSKVGSCAEEVQRQDTRSNGNFVSPSKEEQNKRSSDTNILKEIVQMNQKQCNVLQSLLQQIVAMQSDQMKILQEINEKLSNTRILEDAEPRKYKNASTGSKVLPKMEDARTQTSHREEVDPFCQKYEVRNKQEMPSTQNSPKNMQNNPSFKMNAGSKGVIFQNQDEQEKDQNKPKKLQDRAVSWSAIHGIETVEESFTLHGVCVPTVVDELPSSVHTMHLHVQDYHSSASYDSITGSRHTNDSSHGENGQNNPKGSWTLYDNIVGHVKKFLQTVPGEKRGNASQKTSQVEAIRFATIEKIRQLGVSVYENSTEIKELNAAGRIHMDSKLASRPACPDTPVVEKNSNDASLELQTLALKYLGDDDICDLLKWNQNCSTTSILKTGQKSTNLSLATQHYLEKYHLLPSEADYKDMKNVNVNCGQVCLEENILDITTLKRQPKLL